MVAATYVRRIETSRAFYALLGFEEQSSGSAPTSAWSVLGHGDPRVLLASTWPPLAVPPLPLLFYFYVDDVDAVVARLAAGGVATAHGGCPPHALGGEVRLTDPDGNTVLIGQRDRSPSQPERASDGDSPHFSLLREAASLVAARGGAAMRCQLVEADGTPCPRDADVKLADSCGDTAWACLRHAEQILFSCRTAFIASHDQDGIAPYLARRPPLPA
jgi:catechol 2,3-dioxygenase-like lactoylglutathione lyase family enzyme